MKKLLIVLIIVIIFLTGCGRHEYFNDKDKSDFSDGNSVKFNIIQLKNVIDKNTLKESHLDGGFFLFMGRVSGNSTEKTVLTNTYYGYLKNKNGAIYFAQIPATKVRIYEDSEVPCIVGYQEHVDDISINDENHWKNYDIFNLHIPKGTIIPRIKLNFDIDKFK